MFVALLLTFNSHSYILRIELKRANVVVQQGVIVPSTFS